VSVDGSRPSNAPAPPARRLWSKPRAKSRSVRGREPRSLGRGLNPVGDADPEITNGLGAFLRAARYKSGFGGAYLLVAVVVPLRLHFKRAHVTAANKTATHGVIHRPPFLVLAIRLRFVPITAPTQTLLRRRQVPAVGSRRAGLRRLHTSRR